MFVYEDVAGLNAVVFRGPQKASRAGGNEAKSYARGREGDVVEGFEVSGS